MSFWPKFRSKTAALSISDYAAIGPADGGPPWGDADASSRSIWIPRRRRIVNLSAAYTPTVYDADTFFTIDTAITVTLPASAAAYIGIAYTFYVIADVTVVIAGTAGELVTLNDIAANSFTFSTSSEKISACVEMINTGAKWLTIHHTEETLTVTVTT